MNLIHGNNAVRRQNRLGQISIAVGAALLAMLFFVSKGHAQTQCPADMVCLTRQAALKAIEDSDARKALESENKTLKESVIPQLKDELNSMRVEFARASGENSVLKQQQVRDSAMIELLSKMVRPKKFGIINLF
jgi:hypothetical protein